MKIPTIIMTGFLGSGKTTVISHLIDELQAQGQQVVYIKNELGESDIDGQVLRSQGVLARELLNGCICCTLVGPFTTTITEVIETFKPDRIVIEAAGTADPTALALMVSAHPLLWREVVATVIDVINFEGYLELTTTARQQAKFTDLILFNKVEAVSVERKLQVVGYVRELNEHAPIIETKLGVVPAAVLLGVHPSDLPTTSHHHLHDHLADDELQGISFTPPQTWSKPQWENWLTSLPKTVFRVKGIIPIDGQFWLLNTVARRSEWQLLPDSGETFKPILLVIGYQAQELTSSLEKTLSEQQATSVELKSFQE